MSKSLAPRQGVDMDFREVGRKFAGAKYFCTNKQTNGQLTVASSATDNPHTVAPLWVWPPTAGEDRKWIFLFDEETGGVTIKTVYNNPAWLQRWVSPGPNLRPAPRLCRIFRATGQESDDLYFISPDMGTGPPMVIVDPQPSGVDWGMLIMQPLNSTDSKQMWKITKA